MPPIIVDGFVTSQISCVPNTACSSIRSIEKVRPLMDTIGPIPCNSICLRGSVANVSDSGNGAIVVSAISGEKATVSATSAMRTASAVAPFTVTCAVSPTLY